MSGQIVSDVQAVPSQVGNGRTPMAGWQKIGILALVAIIVLSFVLLHGAGTPRAPVEKAAPVPTIEDAGVDFKAPPALPRMPTTATPSATVATPFPIAGRSFASGHSQSDPAQNALNSDILGSAAGGGASGGSVPENSSPEMLSTDRRGSDNTSLGEALKPTRLEGSRATLLPHPDMTITMGTPFPCTPQEPLTSDAPGMVTCIVPVDIFGTTGHVRLLDAGTKIVGTVQSSMMQGRSRLFVLWQRAETPNPNHVIISLDSPAADELGEAGLDGDVNSHFWQRFGGAIMLSFIDSGLQAAAQLASHTGSSNNSVDFSSFSSGGSTAASTALASTINIPPTLHRDQALPATVFVARDLDFSDVYGLEVAR